MTCTYPRGDDPTSQTDVECGRDAKYLCIACGPICIRCYVHHKFSFPDHETALIPNPWNLGGFYFGADIERRIFCEGAD